MTTSTVKGAPGLVGKNTAGGDGVWGDGTPTAGNPSGRGVVGITAGGSDGVWGESATGRGVVGVSTSGVGVWGDTKTGRAVVGVVQTSGDGVWGETKAGVGVVGISHGTNPTDIGVSGKGQGGGFAGHFDGRVEVTGQLDLKGDVYVYNGRVQGGVGGQVELLSLIQSLADRIVNLETKVNA